MSENIIIDGKEYLTNDLSEAAINQIETLKFVDGKITELKNFQSLLQRAKKSYLEELKREMIARKAGLV